MIHRSRNTTIEALIPGSKEAVRVLLSQWVEQKAAVAPLHATADECRPPAVAACQLTAYGKLIASAQHSAAFRIPRPEICSQRQVERSPSVVRLLSASSLPEQSAPYFPDQSARCGRSIDGLHRDIDRTGYRLQEFKGYLRRRILPSLQIRNTSGKYYDQSCRSRKQTKHSFKIVKPVVFGN